MEIIAEDEFVARFFSNDSIDKFDNTLSKFTVEFDQPLNFGGGDYEVGLSQLFLNPCSHQEPVKNRDIITFNDKHGGEITKTKHRRYDFDEFLKQLLHHSASPEIYTRDYFHEYLDKNIFFDSNALDHHFAKDSTGLTAEEQEKEFVIVSAPLSMILKPGEKVEDFMPHHSVKSKENIEKQAMVSIFFPTMLKTYTMKQILLCVLKYGVLNFRDFMGVDKTIDGHARMFFSAFSAYNSQEAGNKYRREHLHIANKLAHRLVQKFVDTIQLELAQMDVVQMRQNKFLFIYCDVIKPQIVGSKTTRLLYAMPYTSRQQLMFHNQQIVDVQYAKVEKAKIKDISFYFLNENGEQIDFAPSQRANFVVLKFRRVVPRKKL